MRPIKPKARDIKRERERERRILIQCTWHSKCSSGRGGNWM